MKLRVEYAYDPESGYWTFRVPSPGIVGGAESREEAEKRVVDAVAFTLEGEEDGSAPAQTEVRYLHVEIAWVRLFSRWGRLVPLLLGGINL